MRTQGRAHHTCARTVRDLTPGVHCASYMWRGRAGVVDASVLLHTTGHRPPIGTRVPTSTPQ
eukprot:15472541-Alexandrium_andersonii.AAC.1